MLKKIVQFIFFGNYFIGLLAVALSLECSLQLHLPLNSLLYYIIIFCGAVLYYTYAYLGPLHTHGIANERAEWYLHNKKNILLSQYLLITICVFAIIFFLQKNYQTIFSLPFTYWLVISIIPVCGLLYYGLLPKSFYHLNLRNTGWLKAFVIGFVWACCANLLPFIFLRIEKGYYNADAVLLIWLFIKNWMFCTVNAIIFDIKDYADDSNKQLKTFVVKFGLRNTIYFLLLPLLIIGLIAFLIFTHIRNFSLAAILFNLIPFILLIRVAWLMQKPHSIFYYLVVIDGLIFLKAICGITAMHFM